jgi:hypothetical protein
MPRHPRELSKLSKEEKAEIGRLVDAAIEKASPKEMLIQENAGFLRRALAVAAASITSLGRATYILPKPDGPMGSMGHLDDVPGAIKVDPTFKLVFLSSITLTLLVGVGWFWAALFGPSTEAARSLVSGCETITKIGFGAIVGLLGGKTPLLHKS